MNEIITEKHDYHMKCKWMGNHLPYNYHFSNIDSKCESIYSVNIFDE